jgi:hypothetical protein
VSDIEAIIDRAQLPETTVALCLDGPMVAQYERLEVQLRQAGPATSLGDESSAEAVAEAMRVLRVQMLDAQVTFTLRALPPRQFSGLRAKIPVQADGQDQSEHDEAYHQWVCQLLAACAVEPTMTAQQADQLCDRLSEGQWGSLGNAAWAVNTSRQDVPFSAAASVIARGSGARSKPPAPSANPAPDYLAENPPPPPNTTTTNTAD